MTKPTLHPRATTGQAIVDMLFETPGQIVLFDTLVKKACGRSSIESRSTVAQALYRLRKQYPGLEIETVSGYRLRRQS